MRQFNLESSTTEDKFQSLGEYLAVSLERGRLEEAVKLKGTCSLVHFLASACEQHPDNIWVFSFCRKYCKIL